MIFSIKKEKLEKVKSDLLILGLFENQSTKHLKNLDNLIGGAIRKSIPSLFKGEFSEMYAINTLNNLPTKNLLLVGLGKKKDFNSEKLRKLSALSAKYARSAGHKNITFNIHNDCEKSATPLVEGIILGLYRFIKYKTIGKNKIKNLNSITILSSKDKTKAEVEKGKILADGTNFVRDLVNTPASELTPAAFANTAKKIASKNKIKIKIYGKQELKKLGFGGTLAVGRGSSAEPKFVFMQYMKGKGKPIAFVGKGVTFDSGGLDIKPWKYMRDMKCDMAGAACVLGTMETIAKLKLKVNVIGCMPLAENMPGASAYKQGDIIKSFNGKTIEIGHTDAEGRLLLADALAFAEKQKPSGIIDIATLTGASVVALGYCIAPVLGDKKLVNKLKTAGLSTFERLWELPLLQEYKDDVKTEIADVANMSNTSGAAGTITATAFLSNFVEKTPWAHIDIGGTGWYPKDTHYIKSGGTGFGVRLFIKFLENKH
jgi:leucyl aminopeptidase